MEGLFLLSFREILSVPGIKPVLFTLFMASFGFGVILPILPFYVLSLGAKPFELGMLTATFAFMSLLFGPFFGKLSDRVGRKKVLLMGTGGFVLAYLVFAVSDQLWMAFLARAIEGVAAAGIFPAAISLLSDLTDEKQRGPVMGLMGMTFSLGFIVGPAFGGIASSVSVHAAFLMAAGVALLNVLSVHFQFAEPREKAESRDIPAQERSLLMHLRSPLFILFLSSFMITFMIGGIDAVLALYTAERLGFSSAHVGLVFTYIGLLIMAMQVAAGKLINRFGETRLIPAGLFLSGTGFFLLQFADSWVYLLLPLAVFVAGNALVFPSVSSLITKRVTGKRGAVLGLDGSFKSAGQMVGPLLAGFLYGFHPAWAFWGLALCIVAYAVVFLAASPRLSAPA